MAIGFNVISHSNCVSLIQLLPSFLSPPRSIRLRIDATLPFFMQA